MWYNKIVNDLSEIAPFINYYEHEYNQAKLEVPIRGNLEKNIKELPAFTEIRFSQMEEIEAVLRYLEIQMRKVRKDKYVEYETYQKALSSREIDKYVDGSDEVVDFACIINEVALIRNKFQSIFKGFEQKGFMLGHIQRLRSAGLEDVDVG